MIKASFFASSPAAASTEDTAPTAQSLTFEDNSKSFLGVAKAFAEKHGLALADKGRREFSARFKYVISFGITGSTQRMFVWSGN